MDTSKLMEIQYTPREINRKRTAVREALIGGSDNITGGAISRIAAADLELLFQLYDAAFLHDYFIKYFPGRIRFSLSTRMTRAAGKIHYPRNLAAFPPEKQEFEIRIGINFFFNYNLLAGNKTVNGLDTRDALEALQLVFEHEIIHLIELHCYGESSCRKKRFKALAQNIFSHSESYHHLPTEKDIACKKFGFEVGDQVRFNYGGVIYWGFIYRINKRATVMVPDKKGNFQDQHGTKYSKWYVSIPVLEKIY